MPTGMSLGGDTRCRGRFSPIAPQTMNSWRRRGIRELPARETIVRLAEFLPLPYEDLLSAVLRESEYLDELGLLHRDPIDQIRGVTTAVNGGSPSDSGRGRTAP